MGQIKETFILEDMATNPLNGIITAFQNTSAQIQKAASGSLYFSRAASEGYKTVSIQARSAAESVKALGTQGQIDTLSTKLEAQNNLLASQRELVGSLTQEYARTAAELGGQSTQAQKLSEAINKAIIKQANLERAAQRTQVQIGQQSIKLTEANTKAALYNSTAQSIADSFSEASKQVDKLTQNSNKANTGLSAIATAWKTFRNAAIVTAGVKLVKNIASAADQQSQLNARINMMNDGLQTTAELQKMIYTATQNSRGNYANTANMVGKFGTLAPDAFNSSAEVVNFAEQINKHLTLSSASGAGADAVILQLTQAMGAGILRGEELNSVLEQTPTIAQSIAEYMGVSVGEMRKLASEEKITAEVLKNALFATAEETNAKFAEMPMTFSQLWQSGLNAVQQAAMPVLQTIAKGATIIHDNWDTISPVLMGVAAAAGAVALAYGAQTAATLIAKAANDGLVRSLLTNPLTWIAFTIGVVVAAIYKWIQSVGGISVAWLIAKNYVLTAWEQMQIGFMTGVFAVQNWLDTMNLKFHTAGTNIANAVGDMKVNVLTIIQDMVNGAIGLLNDFISSVNKIPGVAIDLVDKVSFAAGAAANNEAEKAARASELSSLQALTEANSLARQAQLSQMQAEAQANQFNRLVEIAKAMEKAQETGSGANSDLQEIPGYVETGDIGKVGSVGSVKNVEGSVNLADEDLKLYRDLAARRYMNQIELKTLAPNINVTLPAGTSGNLTAQDVADKIRAMLIQEMASGTAVSHG